MGVDLGCRCCRLESLKSHLSLPAQRYPHRANCTRHQAHAVRHLGEALRVESTGSLRIAWRPIWRGLPGSIAVGQGQGCYFCTAVCCWRNCKALLAACCDLEATTRAYRRAWYFRTRVRRRTLCAQSTRASTAVLEVSRCVLYTLCTLVLAEESLCRVRSILEVRVAAAAVAAVLLLLCTYAYILHTAATSDRTEVCCSMRMRVHTCSTVRCCPVVLLLLYLLSYEVYYELRVRV